MVESKWIDVGGSRVHYLTAVNAAASSKPPLLLLHGGGTDSASLSWGPHIGDFADIRTVVAPDLPGYGFTERGHAPGTIEHYIGFILHLLDAMHIGRAVIGGISMGGAIGLGLCLRAPERVVGLLLVDSYALGNKIPFAALAYAFVNLPFINKMAWASLRCSRYLTRLSLENIFYDRARVTDSLVDEVSELLKLPGAGHSFMSFQKSEVTPKGLRTDYSDRLHEISCPTLLVHGEHDRLVPVNWARRANLRMPGSVLHVMAKCGHWPNRERPQEFNRVCSCFLKSV